jgi:hypothetical protein
VRQFVRRESSNPAFSAAGSKNRGWMYRHSGGTPVRCHTTQGRSVAHALTIRSPYGQNLASPTWKVLGGYMRSDSEAVADAVQSGHPKARNHHSAEEDPCDPD